MERRAQRAQGKQAEPRDKPAELPENRARADEGQPGQTDDGQTQMAAQQPSIRQATDPAATPFDYIVIGSGAGGGPLAARLALSGRRVLVVEAGVDPIVDNLGANVYHVPAYNAAATEDAVTSWDFSVRHYDEIGLQKQDAKYDPTKDPANPASPAYDPTKDPTNPAYDKTGGVVAKGGIFYPRAAALGGCTSHHAMILIRPNNSDWDEIARFTGDDSWRSSHMQGYYPKIEQNLYYGVYSHFFGRILGGILALVQWLVTKISPRSQLDPNGHGFKGWQPTSFIDPIVIAAIARGDWTFLRLLLNVVWAALAGERSNLFRVLKRFQIIQFLDPNVPISSSIGREQRKKELKNSRLSLISIGTDGKQRFGLREWLLKVAEEHPDRLVLMTGAHVTRLIFAKDAQDEAPRAVGVEVVHGKYLYRASKQKITDADRGKAVEDGHRAIFRFGRSHRFGRIVQHAAIADAERHRRRRQAEGFGHRRAARCRRQRADAGDRPARRRPQPAGPLRGQRHLRDEERVLHADGRQLQAGGSERPGVPAMGEGQDRPLRNQWRRAGAAAGLVRQPGKAKNEDEVKADLFIFGVPAAFRGYYWNWSNELL